MSTQTERQADSSRDQYFKIKLCPFHLQGICKKGKSCSFAHNDQEVRVGISLRKTKMCHAWQKGECFEKDCKFAHGELELRNTPDYYKTSLCKYWVQGSCPQGNACRHAHGEHELRNRSYKYTNTEKRQIPKNAGCEMTKETRVTRIDSARNKDYVQKMTPSGTTTRCKDIQPTLSTEVSTIVTDAMFKCHGSTLPPPGLPSPVRSYSLAQQSANPRYQRNTLVEFYDGRVNDYVLLPREAYKTPKACGVDSGIMFQDGETFVSNVNTTDASFSTTTPLFLDGNDESSTSVAVEMDMQDDVRKTGGLTNAKANDICDIANLRHIFNENSNTKKLNGQFYSSKYDPVIGQHFPNITSSVNAPNIFFTDNVWRDSPWSTAQQGKLFDPLVFHNNLGSDDTLGSMATTTASMEGMQTPASTTPSSLEGRSFEVDLQSQVLPTLPIRSIINDQSNYGFHKLDEELQHVLNDLAVSPHGGDIDDTIAHIAAALLSMLN